MALALTVGITVAIVLIVMAAAGYLIETHAARHERKPHRRT